MVKRVVIGPYGSSPFRVSVAGVSVDTAQFDDLIFDGNQPPLRIATVGYAEVPVIDRANDSVKTIEHVITAAPIPAVPSGTTPLFLVATRQRRSNDGGTGSLIPDVLTTPYSKLGQGTQASISNYGGGGAISDVDGAGLRFVALSFSIRQTYQPAQPWGNLINYCIFRNAQ